MKIRAVKCSVDIQRRDKILVLKRHSKVFAACAFLGALIAFAGNLAGTIHLPLRKRNPDNGAVSITPGTLRPRQTAVLICDMWDRHWCDGATQRVEMLAHKIEPLLEQARAAGMLIIHAPSETMSFYENTPARLLAVNAPPATPPKERPLEAPPLPIDDSDGGCDTGNKTYQAWKRETPLLPIEAGDVVSDRGAEIYNLIAARHIDTVLIMGVHANMCILNRSFGIKQMARWGVPCILVRDLTDAMYNPMSRPYVSHAAGTDLVIQHIEKYWAPTTTSDEVVAALRK